MKRGITGFETTIIVMALALVSSAMSYFFLQTGPTGALGGVSTIQVTAAEVRATLRPGNLEEALDQVLARNAKIEELMRIGR